jgi:hypothetical protein
VDVHRTVPTRAIIIDYKTGRLVPKKEMSVKMADGRMLQLPLYAAAFNRQFPHFQVVGAAYVYLNERETKAERAVARVMGPSETAKPAEVPLDLDAATRKALQLIGDMRAGVFPLSEHAVGSAFVECTSFCSLRHVCRQPTGYRSNPF